METFQQVAAVGLVLGFAVLAAYGSRKMKAGVLFGRPFATGTSSRMSLIQRLMLTPQHSICMLRVDERDVVVGLHPGGMTVLEAKRDSVERGAR